MTTEQLHWSSWGTEAWQKEDPGGSANAALSLSPAKIILLVWGLNQWPLLQSTAKATSTLNVMVWVGCLVISGLIFYRLYPLVSYISFLSCLLPQPSCAPFFNVQSKATEVNWIYQPQTLDTSYVSSSAQRTNVLLVIHCKMSLFPKIDRWVCTVHAFRMDGSGKWCSRQRA